MQAYTIDVIALVVLSAAGLTLAAWQFYQLDRVLADPDHPHHEMAKEAVKESETHRTLGYWWDR